MRSLRRSRKPMNHKLVPAAPFINNFGVSDPRQRLLNILYLNGGSMSVGTLISESSDPHEVTVYTITDFLRDGLVASGPTPSTEPHNPPRDPALDFRLSSDAEVHLTASGKSAMENSA